jgi:methylglutaconyl-CoA hydratase
VMSSAPEAVAELKTLFSEIAHKPLDHTLTESMAQQHAAKWSSPEAREGVAAYLERRKPQWTR